MAAIPAHGRITRETLFSLSPFAPEKLVRVTGSAVPSCVSLLILYTQAESSA